MVPVFYDPRQHATEPEMAALTAMREKAVLEHCLGQPLLAPLDLPPRL
jgi:hypothetical protein